MAGFFSGRLQAEFTKRTKRSDGKYFQASGESSKRGEQEELRSDLNGSDTNRQKDAIKRIIANMTVGRDVSPLFMDVVKLSHTTNIEVKKLVYLYIMANARLNPGKAIIAVNTFVQDSMNTSPVIRALAIRTMLCVHVEDEHSCAPLSNALKDKNDYVRKTAAIGVLKLYHSNPKLCEEQGFLDELQVLLTDSSPMVVANAVMVLNEIIDNAGYDMQKTAGLTSKLLNILQDCTEWGQVNVLDFLSKTRCGEQDAQSLIDRVIPRLQQGNPAVLMSTIRCIVSHLDVLSDEKKRAVLPKLTPSFVSLMRLDGETQYIALRNIQLMLQKYTGLFGSKDVKVFFCQFADPTCVKLEKLNMLLRLFSERNIDLILRELREYCDECEEVFVARSVQTLGACAVRLESAAVKVAEILVSLVTKPNLIQPVLSAVKDVLRKEIEVDLMEDAEAKCSLVWCMGEFGEQLPDVKEKLLFFVECFDDQPTSVQDVLGKATTNENPDLRDRAYMYWRMLSNEQNAAKMSTFVVGQKPPINAEGIEELDPSRLNELLSSFGSVAAVYHKTPGVFVPRYGMPEKVDDADDDEDEEGLTDNLLAEHSAAPSPADSPAPVAPTPPPQVALPQLLDPALCGGLKVCGAFAPGAVEGKLELRLELTNTSPAPMAQFAMQFNTNILGLKGDAPLAVESLAPGTSAVAAVAVSAYPEHVNKDNTSLQLAFRNSAGNPYYCVCNPPLREALAATGMLAKADFIPRWKQIASEVKFDVATPPNCDFHAALQEMKVIFVGGKAPVRYYSARTLNGVNLLIEASAGQADITGVVSSVQICAKADDMAYTGAWLQTALSKAFKALSE